MKEHPSLSLYSGVPGTFSDTTATRTGTWMRFTHVELVSKKDRPMCKMDLENTIKEHLPVTMPLAKACI